MFTSSKMSKDTLNFQGFTVYVGTKILEWCQDSVLTPARLYGYLKSLFLASLSVFGPGSSCKHI